MSGYLIDTNILSEYTKPSPNDRVMLWFERVDPEELYASVVTFAEILIGIEALEPGKRRTALEAWIEAGLPDWFDTHLLPVSRETARRWAILTVQAKRQGRQLHTPDGLIAATALEHDLTVVTRNVRDFGGLGLTIFNPWDDLLP